MTEEADAAYRAWLCEILDAAAEDFGLTLSGPPRFGWRLRSASVPAESSDGPCWVRVMTEDTEWAHGDWWTGNADANVLTGLSKPRVLHVTEAAPGRRSVRVEVMTRQPGRPCSSTDVLRSPLPLPDAWWDDLRASLGRLAATPTDRPGRPSDRIVTGIRERLGVDVDPAALRWETVHGDLHWANLFTDPFGLVDWDHWGRGLVGEDAATLYCYSLLRPETADRVHATFAHVLDTPDGARAQMAAVARLLKRAELGDHPDLVPELRRLAERFTVR